MTAISPFETHVEEYEAWFEKYPYAYQTEINAIRSQMQELPEDLIGIEVGLGTGRYAMELGIKEGVEPSENMRIVALDRGIEVMDAKAESLPYKDISFDFVLFVTICHLDDIHRALKEAYRVLKPGGSLIIGFIDRHSQVGQLYEKNKKRSTFYRQAHFYSVEDVKELLKEARFKEPVFTQTIFGEIENIKMVQIPREGFGEGSFVVVRACK
ncbi:class I SAM-dependent methyltransferase [Algoriphagus sp. CAU 1675]|uniref:class I SAM-dependent methyltransferase n=1 Tax=Algoriphagus sp. CAU 1675 TaxID=3032597 RepID=UPI0023DA246A|nr:class I SAM-dependent methyltransferase [Algoriphagus sp. CAU 1675]MDF2159148.1 class I SAM-dependent methyltransferase [Algoriphagus sp. CAU 1675]